VRTPWRHDLPGAVLALLLWIGGSYLLRFVLAESIGGTSIYGPLAAPIAVLLWLYLIVISLLMGAAFNASIDEWLGRRPGGNGYRRIEGSAGDGAETRAAEDAGDADEGAHRGTERAERNADGGARAEAGGGDHGGTPRGAGGGAPAQGAAPDDRAQGAASTTEAGVEEGDRHEGRPAVTSYDQPLPFDESAGETVAGQPGVP